MDFKIAEILSEYELVINGGKEHGFHIGQRVLVYLMGTTTKDPDSGKPIEDLEVVIGTGKVTTLRREFVPFILIYKIPRNELFEGSPPPLLRGLGNIPGQEEVIEQEVKAFENPKIGDLAKRILRKKQPGDSFKDEHKGQGNKEKHPERTDSKNRLLLSEPTFLLPFADIAEAEGVSHVGPLCQKRSGLLFLRIDVSPINTRSFFAMTTKEFIEEALCLPVEDRAMIADALLRSLNVPDAEIDAKWLNVAKRRLEELRSGKIKAISGDDVFIQASKRFAK